MHRPVTVVYSESSIMISSVYWGLKKKYLNSQIRGTIKR